MKLGDCGHLWMIFTNKWLDELHSNIGHFNAWRIVINRTDSLVVDEIVSWISITSIRERSSDQTNVWMIFAQFWSHQHVDDFLNLPHEEWIHRSNKHGGEFNPEFSIADKLAKTIRFCFDRNKWYLSIYYYSNWCQRHPWVYHQCVTACMH